MTKEISQEDIVSILKSGGNDSALFLLEKINTVEDDILEFETKLAEVKALIPNLDEVLKSVRGMQGEPGKNPVAGVDYPIPTNGDNYILTEEDRKQIAQTIKVPIVEKVIEKTTVVKEQPIVTEITKTTNEIKEVAVTDSAEVIVEKINELPVDDPEFQIDASHIKNLPKQKEAQFVGGITGRDLFQDIDISAQLDGSTKTFNIQAVWRIITVDLSSFPYALRKNIDYTWTPTSITFTDQVDAPSTLASGQTCVLTVVTG